MDNHDYEKTALMVYKQMITFSLTVQVKSNSLHIMHHSATSSSVFRSSGIESAPLLLHTILGLMT